MEITQEKSGSQLVLTLTGRLDASWCEAVEKALSAAIRGGEHRLLLDMAGVDYISSAGLRVIFSVYKQLLAINGQFGIRNPSKNVETVLRMVGIAQLISTGPTEAPAEESGARRSSAKADYDVFPLSGTPMVLQRIGSAAALTGTPGEPPETRQYPAGSVALGLGALGADWEGNRSRVGEFLAAAGAAAFQPADGSPRPDFVVAEGELVPDGQIVLGFHAHGDFSALVRFAAHSEARAVGLAELAATALEVAGTDTAVVLAVTETAGLVGATLRQSVTPAGDAGRFQFPEIRDWLAFSSERSHRDSTSLLVGVVGTSASPFRDLLRPHGTVLAHFHAAAFPYRPLQKGRIALDATVRSLFDSHALSAVLHLLCDPREIQGAGESEFTRGALWIAPVSTQP